MKTIAAYVRVSTREQKINGLSVDNQIQALTEYAKENGYQVKIYSDAGISAHISYKKRPAMLQMIKDCQSGLVQLICVTKLDRFFRSVPDYYAVIEQINNVPWRAIWEDYETETSAGQFKVNIMLAIAQAEAERTSERIKAVVQYKKDVLGEYVGNCPFGYKRVNKQIVKDEATAPIVDMIIASYTNNTSLCNTNMDLKAQGYSVSKYIIKNVLTNSFYTGKANRERFEPYLTEEQHRLFNEIANRRHREKAPNKKVHLLSGILKCSICGRNMLYHSHYSSRKKADGQKYFDIYPAYRCGGSTEYKCVPSVYYEKKLEKRIIAEIDKIINQPYSASFSEKEDKSAQKKIESLNGRIKRLADMFEMGDISREKYIEKRDSLKIEIANLEALRQNSRVFPVLPAEWKEVYNALDEDHRRTFLNKIIKSIYVSRENLVINFL